MTLKNTNGYHSRNKDVSLVKTSISDSKIYIRDDTLVNENPSTRLIMFDLVKLISDPS